MSFSCLAKRAGTPGAFEWKGTPEDAFRSCCHRAGLPGTSKSSSPPAPRLRPSEAAPEAPSRHDLASVEDSRKRLPRRFSASFAGSDEELAAHRCQKSTRCAPSDFMGFYRQARL